MKCSMVLRKRSQVKTNNNFQYYVTHLLKLIKWDVHQSARTQYFEHLCAEIAGDCLQQSQRPLDRVLGGADLAQVVKDRLHSDSDAVEFRG